MNKAGLFNHTVAQRSEENVKKQLDDKRKSAIDPASVRLFGSRRSMIYGGNEKGAYDLRSKKRYQSVLNPDQTQ